jgi:hypothetical protein
MRETMSIEEDPDGHPGKPNTIEAAGKFQIYTERHKL